VLGSDALPRPGSRAATDHEIETWEKLSASTDLTDGRVIS
jgi:hypothetical protein